ncbi:MAG: hypothetical protein BWY86_01458 [Candidatus Aminicenantes bacterium ADurb.Bin508]|nr:MAG: hypothetical protein BWY86_01458 [Candidatus Aminicenantes bacterium ADurb.Bin508]
MGGSAGEEKAPLEAPEAPDLDHSQDTGQTDSQGTDHQVDDVHQGDGVHPSQVGVEGRYQGGEEHRKVPRKVEDTAHDPCTGLKLNEAEDHIGQKEGNGRRRARPRPEEVDQHLADRMDPPLPILGRHGEADHHHSQGDGKVVENRLKASFQVGRLAHADGAHPSEPLAGDHRRADPEPHGAPGHEKIAGRAGGGFPRRGREEKDEEEVAGDNDHMERHGF